MSFRPYQLDPFFLAGAGAIVGDTSVVLKSMNDIDGSPVTMSQFGAIGYGTLEPGNSNLEEQISFSGITQNANGTATLTGVMSVGFVYPYTSTSGLMKTHAGSTSFVISNTSGFYSQAGFKSNNEILTGFWEAPDPLTLQGIATKNYVDSVVSGGTVTSAAVIAPGTAGETVSAGQVVYLKAADGLWYKASSASAATTDLLQLGIAQGAGTISAPITGGVLLKGYDQHQSGLVGGTIYYLSTGGAISSSAGTVERAVGQANSPTILYFDPVFFYVPTANQKAAFAGISGTAPSSTNLFIDEVDLVGMVCSFAGAATPTGWLPCDGSAVSRSTYARLFAKISTTYGTGNGSTTFNVPNAATRVIIGTGTGTKVLTFASRSSNVITVTGAANSSINEIQTGQAVLYAAPSGAMTGLTTNTTYYIVRISSTTFSLASTLANAQNGVVVSLSSDGTGTQTFTYTFATVSLGDTGGEQAHAMSITELLAHVHTAPGANTTTNGSVNWRTADNTNNSTPTTNSTGGNAAMNVMQPFLGLNYFIKI